MRTIDRELPADAPLVFMFFSGGGAGVYHSLLPIVNNWPGVAERRIASIFDSCPGYPSMEAADAVLDTVSNALVRQLSKGYVRMGEKIKKACAGAHQDRTWCTPTPCTSH